MPTVLHVDGLQVRIYPNDHRPEHVHVIGHGCEAVFRLHCPGGPPTLWKNFGFSQAELNHAMTILDTSLNKLCQSWRAIHGLY